MIMATNIVVPELGESVVEATVLRWLKQEGERVAAGETLVELETEKVNLDVSAPRAGVLAKIEHKAGDAVKIGDVLGVIETEPAAETTAPAPSTAPEKPATVESQPPAAELPGPAAGDGINATPVARRMAQERGIDLRSDQRSEVKPGAPGQRITKQDIEDYLERQQKQQETPSVRAPTEQTAERAAPPPRAVPQPAVAAAETRREERIRLSRRRQTIARRLVEAQQTAAMLTTFNEVDMSAVLDLRKRQKESFKQRYGVGLGITSFFVKAAVAALKAFPRLNAEIQGDEMVLKHYYDIGIAVGASEGLVVPVLRAADRLSFPEIERKINEFAEKAEAGTLSLEDLRGGTFTITNGGVFGSLMSTPILNPPQVGILGLHQIQERPVAREGQVVIHPMMYLALSYDHRLVDGREAVQFLSRIKELVQEPDAMLLQA